MRFIGLAALGFFIAISAMAQTNAATGTTHNFGSATCRQHVVCPDDPHATAAAYVAGANACMNEGFGYVSPAGYFDAEAGLDGNFCLTPIPNSIPKGAGAQLTPSCCVVRAADNGCVFHCDINAYQ